MKPDSEEYSSADLTEEERELDEYDSGPFCRHYGDPSDCDEVCDNCGCRCTRHGFAEPGACMDCDCKEWRAKP